MRVLPFFLGCCCGLPSPGLVNARSMQKHCICPLPPVVRAPERRLWRSYNAFSNLCVLANLTATPPAWCYGPVCCAPCEQARRPLLSSLTESSGVPFRELSTFEGDREGNQRPPRHISTKAIDMSEAPAPTRQSLQTRNFCVSHKFLSIGCD